MKVKNMTTEEDDEIQSLVEYYLRSRANEFSRYFNGLTGAALAIISTSNIDRRSTSKILSSLKSPKLSLVLSITLVLSLVTGLSMMGLLQDETMIPPILDIEVHSGYWDRIPVHASTNRVFTVENPSEHSLTLELKTLNWNPIMASKDVEVSWDYDGTPLLPGETTEISINLENIGIDGTILVSLDIHIIGKLS